MGLGSYYVHVKYKLYRKYGIHRANGDDSISNYGNERDPETVARNMINLIKNESQRRTKGSPEEAQNLALFMTLTNRKNVDTSNSGIKENQRFEQIREKIEETLKIKATDYLDLDDQTKQELSSLIQTKIAQENLNKAKKNIQASAKQHVRSKKEIDSLLKRINKVASQGPSGPNARQFKNLYTRLKKYLNENYLSANFETTKNDRSYKLGSHEGKLFLQLLSELDTLIGMGNAAELVGDMGEMFGAAAALVYYCKENEMSDELIDELLDNLLKNGFDSKNSPVRIIGAETSGTAYRSLANGQDVISKSQAINIKDADNLYHLNFTKDKVDFTITLPDSKERRNFSMKNYSQSSEVTVLSGNIYPFFTWYPEFTYHYLNIMQSHNDENKKEKENIETQMYKAALALIGLRAVSGGVMSYTKNDTIVRGEYADYFALLNNKTGRATVLPIQNVISSIANTDDPAQYLVVEPDVRNWGLVEGNADTSTVNSLRRLQGSRHVYLRVNKLRESIFKPQQ